MVEHHTEPCNPAGLVTFETLPDVWKMLTDRQEVKLVIATLQTCQAGGSGFVRVIGHGERGGIVVFSRVHIEIVSLPGGGIGYQVTYEGAFVRTVLGDHIVVENFATFELYAAFFTRTHFAMTPPAPFALRVAAPCGSIECQPRCPCGTAIRIGDRVCRCGDK